MRVLVTGAAGFIGFHLARRLLDRGDSVIGLDNLNPYYDVDLKQARLDLLRKSDGFRFVKADLADRNAMEDVFAGRVDAAARPADAGRRFDAVVNDLEVEPAVQVETAALLRLQIDG